MSEESLPAALSSPDRGAVSYAASSAPRWVEQVDRLQPVDLIQRILDETDYARWFAAPKGAQGWENLKKVLELIRKAQNRGYLTMSRLADYLGSASAGDESAAVLEAVDAVNLMTIHAAKGLEFPAVFVVNLEQRTRTDTSLPRIREHADGRVDVHALGSPEVEGPDRATEEEKRLLYVALTRAKTRLALSASRLLESESHDSLLSLLPEGLRKLFHEAASTEGPELPWRPGSSTHRLRILRPRKAAPLYRREEPTPPLETALEPLKREGPEQVTVSELVAPQATFAGPSTLETSMELAVGHAVHRLFEHGEYEVEEQRGEHAFDLDQRVYEAAAAFVPHLAAWSSSELEELARRAASIYQRLIARPELQILRSGATVQREVPFALRRDGLVIRGVIDALAVSEQGVVVLDYKTGAPRPEHRAQMEIYIEAAAALFPRHAVQGWILYPDRDPVKLSASGAGESASTQLRLFEE